MRQCQSTILLTTNKRGKGSEQERGNGARLKGPLQFQHPVLLRWMAGLVVEYWLIQRAVEVHQ